MNGPNVLALKTAVLPLGRVQSQPTQEEEQNQPIALSHKKQLREIRLKKKAGIYFSKFMLYEAL